MHVAHVGLDGAGRIEASQNVEPGWTMILEELHGFGVPPEEIKMVERRDSLDFVEGFLAGAKASLVQELRKTSTAARSKRSHAGEFLSVPRGTCAPTGGLTAGYPDAGFVPRPVQRKRIPAYY